MKLLLRVFILLVLSGGSASTTQGQEKLMFSPNGDKIKDEVTFKLSLQQNTGISRWLFEIKEESGALVKSFSEKGQPPGEIKWDGKDLTNSLVKDGIYVFALSLVTPAGNQQAIPPSPLVVDRVAPQAEAAVEPVIFSPNGDGVKDEAQFNLKAEDANGIHSWLLTIKDREGAPARSIGGKAAPPPVLRWDGRGDFEEDVPDGNYTFELTVNDYAGNKWTSPPRTVTINRAGLVSTVEVTPMLFSPNGDGFKDETTFRISSGDPDSVDHWRLRILNRNGKIVHEFSGRKEPPQRMPWNGKIDDKKLLPDGLYQVTLSETDRAGNTASTTPQPMEIDTASPLLEARLEPTLLSPNGDGFQDQGLFHLKADDEHPLEKWSLAIVNDVGRTVKTFSGLQGTKPPAKLPWQGDNEEGPLTDGSYTYFLEAKDIAGNGAMTSKQAFRIDRTPPIVGISAEPILFSPNGDGHLDEMNFQSQIQDASPLESWQLAIQDAKGSLVRSFTGPANALPARIPWDGKNQDRVPLPDGEYIYVLTAKDIAGNRATSPNQKLTIGATRPTPQVVVDPKAISPNADGFKDEATFRLQAPSFNRILEWSLKLWDKSGLAQRTFSGRGDVPGTLVWRGERDDKRPLPDAEYTYALEVVDAAGNRIETRPQVLRMDTTKPEISVRASPNLFSPNGDGLKDETLFIPIYKDASPIANWQLTLQNSSQKTVRLFSGKDKLPLSITWKGDNDSGAYLSDGAYTYTFSAEDEVGNKAVTSEQIVHIDNSPPQASLQVEPALFSPNGDGVKDETNLFLDAKDTSDISQWKVTLEANQISRTFSGLGRPPKNFPWDGKNERGQALPDSSYTAVLSVTDEVGNTGKSPEVSVTLDTSKPMVTVTAETEPLQELTPQMTVTQAQGDLVIALSSEVLFDTAQATLKSQAYATLMRATHLIRRYPRRKVRIEGHADTVPIHNPQFRNNLELSEARAKAVMNFFVEKGNIDRSRLSAQGFGDTRPKASNDTESGRKINRRVEIILPKEN